jgi:membrane protein
MSVTIAVVTDEEARPQERTLELTLRGIGRRAFAGELSITAAGIALFTLLAAIPALAAVISIYGLIADPANIEAHLDGLVRIFPVAVVDFLIGQLERAAQASNRDLGATLLFSLLIALYCARNATNAVIAGLNRAYGLAEERSMLRRLVTSILVAVAAMLGMLIVMGFVVALPATTKLLGFSSTGVLDVLRWPLVIVMVTALLVSLYKSAPSGGRAHERRVVPGALVGTAMWLLASFGLSVWVDKVADYQILYGAFAGVIVVILWFYLSALSVLVGAAVNAELGPSLGPRNRWRVAAGREKQPPPPKR